MATRNNRLLIFLEAWTALVVQNARVILVLLAILTGLAAWYAVTAFSMNSDTGRLIRQDTNWKADHTAFVTTFPQYDQNSIVVLTGPKPDALAKATRALGEEIRSRTDIFSQVYTPTANAFTDRNMLLYLDEATLSDTISKLADAQPFLTAVASDDSLHNLLTLLTDAISTDETLPTGFNRIASVMAIAAERAQMTFPAPISWRDELFQVASGETYYQLILVKGRQEFGKDLPNGLVVGELESVLAGFTHPWGADISIRLTGQVPLEHAEIVSALDSAQLAGSIALILLVVVLVWGVRSLRIIAATYLSMLCGLIWTAAFAMFAVGQYNTISIIFLVMFIGLGVDFAVHLCLRYQESLSTTDKSHALIETGVSLGPAIMLCGVTSAIGFLSFVPTDYIGLGEMGIISGGGMIIAVIVSLTLIPAFFAVVSEPQPPTDLPFARVMSTIVADHPGPTTAVTLCLGVVLVLISTQASFDYSTLGLKDPDSEAMVTLAELHEQDIVTDYALTYIADDLEAAVRIQPKLTALSEVADVKTPRDYLPANQTEKRYMLEDAGFLLDSVFYAAKNPTPVGDEGLLDLLVALNDAIDNYQKDERAQTPELLSAMGSLRSTVQQLQEADAATRLKFTRVILPPLQAEIEWLRTALSPDEITLSSMPPDLLARLVAPQGRVVVSVTPAEDVVPVAAMRRFTEAVLEVAPGVTGRPVLDLGIGEIVIRAFLTALAVAVSTIFIILLMTLRSLLDACLVFIPLAMTALVTLSASVLLGLPLNMANVVVIPLIFGLGVDNGIHIVKRYHQLNGVAELVRSSTPKAVFLSNLTTLGTFCALSLSTHQGIFSIGILLTVALLSLMILTLIALPALLATFSKPQTVLGT